MIKYAVEHGYRVIASDIAAMGDVGAGQFRESR
jgi:hypothetical protein